MTKNAVRLAVSISVLMACASTLAKAQTNTGALPSREQIELPKVDAPHSPQAPKISSEAIRQPCTFADTNLQVDLQHVDFEGIDGSALPQEITSLLAGIKPQAGRQPLASLCALRDNAAQTLDRAGYIAAVVIPSQEITTGTAKLRVIMARLTDVEISGDAGPYRKLVEKRAERLRSLTPLNRLEAERLLLLANDVPGLDISLNLRAGAQPGEVIGTLSVHFSRYAVLAHIDNYGSEAIGREIATARLDMFGLGGAPGQSYIGVSTSVGSKEQQVAQLGHYAVFDSGLNLGGRLSVARTRPDLGMLDLRSDSIVAGVDLTAPIFRSMNRNLSWGGGFEAISQTLDLHAGSLSMPVTRDKLSVAYARLTGSTNHSFGEGANQLATAGVIEIRKGLDLFDASKRGQFDSSGYATSRTEGDPEATVIRGSLDARLTLSPAFSVAGQVQGQWTDTPLLSSEEFAVGNLSIGRGYDPAVTSGDKAIALRVEPRFQWRASERAAAQAFVFYDNVRIWNKDTFAEPARTLSSWGGGVRVFMPNHLIVEAAYAKPLDAPMLGAARPSDRLLISLTAQFPAK